MELIKRMKLWIAIGAVVVASGVAFGVWFLPLRKQASVQASEWAQKAAGVEAIVGKIQSLRTESAVQEARKAKEANEAQLSSVTAAIQERDKLLERYIPEPETNAESAHEGGVWKILYAKQVKALNDDIRKSFQSAPDPIVSPKDYGDRWPDEPEMVAQAKNYWIQRYLLEALADANKARMVVPVLKSFSLPSRPDRLLLATHGTMFRPVAFQFQIRTQFENVPFVLERLLKCKVGVAITTLDVARSSEGAAVATETGPALTPKPAAGVVSAGGPPLGFGPPAGVGMGAAGAQFGAEQAAAAAARARGMGMMRPSMRSSRPSAVRRPGVLAAAVQGLPRDLVDVTIGGYVLDYVPPKASETK